MTLSSDQIAEQLAPVFCGIIEVPSFSMELEMSAVDTWDSLRHIQLMAAIEELFGIEIGFEDAVEMISVRQIIVIIGKYLPRVLK